MLSLLTRKLPNPCRTSGTPPCREDRAVKVKSISLPGHVKVLPLFVVHRRARAVVLKHCTKDSIVDMKMLLRHTTPSIAEP